MHQPRNSPAEKLPILRGVSRSFYVSIRLLPAQLRQPVATAYLLARATDTIADTTEMPAGERREKLNILASAIENDAVARASIVDLVASFAPLQKNDSEKNLIQALPQCLAWLAELEQADREDVRGVLRKITQGQALDVDRFGQTSEMHALATAAELDEYTYLVAGCVGEFWTELCFRHLRDFAKLPKEKMRELGKSYGMGLQLINILRDAHSDLAAGRCYFPADELAAADLSPAEIVRQPDRFQTVYRKWLEEAARGIDFGMQYVSAIHSRRVRAATALPALIGARTLALLRAAGTGALQKKSKVPRKEVRAMIGWVALTLADRRQLHAMFGRLSR